MTHWSFCHANDVHLGTPRSYRYDPTRNHNWANIRKQMIALEPDLLLVGGDHTRDGDTHEYEYEMCKADLESLPFPSHMVPGNMDVGNKHTMHDNPPLKAGRSRDVELNFTSQRMSLFASYFGSPNWTFAHRDVRFTGFYAAVAGSGLPEEGRFWRFLQRLENLPKAKHHVAMMHYALFIDDIDEPTFDSREKSQYLNWYFGIDREPRLRIFDLLKRANVEIVFSGHIHCRRPVQVVDGVRFYKTPSAGGHAQWEKRWDDADTTIGFHHCLVGDDGIDVRFIPGESPMLKREMAGYGPFGHPKPHERDYSVATEKPPLGVDHQQC